MITARICEECRSSYMPDNNGQKYCNITCKKKALKNPKTYTDRKCIICNWTFTPLADYSACCSKKCNRIRNKNIAKYGKICGTCGNVFKPVNIWQTYCNRKCWKKSNPTIIKEKICKECKDVFVPMHNFSQYCSETCKVNHNIKPAKIKRTQIFHEKECKNCEKMYVPTHGRQLYCSVPCRDAPRKIDKICQECKSTFTTIVHQQKYCSLSCRLKYTNNKKNLKYKNDESYKEERNKYSKEYYRKLMENPENRKSYQEYHREYLKQVNENPRNKIKAGNKYAREQYRESKKASEDMNLEYFMKLSLGMV